MPASDPACSPTILVVFGATGDLMARKIVPALYHLWTQGRLPERFRVVGFARRPFPDPVFQGDVARYLQDRSGVDAADPSLGPFLERFHYHQGQFDDTEAYRSLGDVLAGIDDEWGTCANKLYYLAVPPQFYRSIFQHLADSGIAKGCGGDGGWTRVLVEKPFGKDAATAQQLDELLGSLFAEEQIYRIDHYLAKEMLQGIMSFRFSNNLLEPTWNARNIQRIEISLLESLGVEDRGDTYDALGALRDVGQNHLLQMLALVTMDQPATLDAPSIRAKRAEVLEALHQLSSAEVGAETYRAQHDGYRDIEGVAPDSRTETYFRLRTSIETARWSGVPVTLQAGKRIADVRKEIVVTFKHPSPCLCESAEHYDNKVVFTLEPSESIRIEFFTKKPGFENELEKRDFNFMLYEKQEKAQYVEEYAKLLYDCIIGDQTLFVSTAEVRAMWEFTDSVESGWAADATPLRTYAPDTNEPVERSSYIGRTRFVFPGRAANEIGIIGLGRMGGGIARRLAERDWKVVAWNRHHDKAEALRAEFPDNVVAAKSIAELVSELALPRLVWLMLPAGEIVDRTLFDDGGLASLLEEHDIVIDGGNSHYKDSVRRGERLEKANIVFTDVGVSGGPAGARWGACLMIGGKRETYARLEQLWRDLARDSAYRFFPGHGAGHFVKMVHNGIEYGMMQSLAEGFAILRASPYKLDLIRAAEVYDNGSVIESRLVGWLLDAFERHGEDLTGVSGAVGHTGEGEWTVDAAREYGVPARVIADALQFRLDSQEHPDYTGQVLSALRESFGGHSIAGAQHEPVAPAADRELVKAARSGGEGGTAPTG